MMIRTDDMNLQTAGLHGDEFRDAFHIAMLTAATADCASAAVPNLRAPFGETLAMHLALCRRHDPGEADAFRMLLSDYLRFCRNYLKDCGVHLDGFAAGVYRTILFNVKMGYRKGKDANGDDL